MHNKYHNYFLNTYSKYPISVDRASGCFIYSGKKKYLDMISGIGVMVLGHSVPELLTALRKQIKLYLHVSNLLYDKSQIKFGEEFLKTLQKKYKIFLSNSGAEAIEASIKFSRLFFQGKKMNFLCFVGAFHGRTTGALSATWKEEFKKPFYPLLGGFNFVNYGDLEAVEAELKTGKYAAVIVEPIQGESGVITPPKGFLKELANLCKRTETLLVVDEIQTGVGKTGKFWCFEWDGIFPDILTSSKAIGGGLPLGVTAVSEEISECVKPGLHASTFGGNPLSCVAGTYVISRVRREKFLREVAVKGNYLAKKIKEEIGFGVDGKGLMLGITLGDENNLKKKPTDINQFLIERGIIANVLKSYKGDIRIRILPPLVIQKKEIDLFLDVLWDLKKNL